MYSNESVNNDIRYQFIYTHFFLLNIGYWQCKKHSLQNVAFLVLGDVLYKMKTQMVTHS